MPDEGEHSASACSQVFFLLALMLRLKMWKFLFWVLIVPVLFLNYFTMRSLESSNPDSAEGASIKGISADSASSWVTLVSSSAAEEIRSMKEIMQNRGAKSQTWLSPCKSTPDCQASFIDSVLSLSDATRAFMRFDKTISQFECLDARRADLICSYLFHVMSQSMDRSGSKAPSVFMDVQFLKFFDKFETETSKRQWLRANISAPDSLCTRSARNSGAFFDYSPDYFMVHVVLLAATMTLYFTVSTLSSVSGLKENGFLQLIFNSGLSVGSYWFVVWLITLIEALVIAALVVTSYSTQCPSFYASDGLVKAFGILVSLYLFMASLGLFFSTVLGSYFITLLLLIFLNVLQATVALFCRKHVATAKGKVKGDPTEVFIMLIFPPGHIAEYLIEVMFPETPIYKRQTGYSEYYSLIQILMASVPAVLSVLTIYLDFILKNGNGLCLPMTFPLNPNFWNPYRQKLLEMVDNQPKRANVEPTTGVPAVIASDIFMTYSAGLCCAKLPPVLKGVTCTVYQGQITALIGHNGAGKTTLIRVLMGEEIPTSGVAVINGHRVTDPYQRLALRGSVSICKQVDVLSNCLTVMESIKLTLVAKGFSLDSQVDKALDMLKQLGLEGKENVKARDLSGGQMRKVCSILCLLGNPKLVILDEPTSGLDPVSRRNLWQILQDHKAGRSIILCTQFMDEADILSDRKMFLSGGKLICAGSSIFLKHAFGCCVSINVSLKSKRYARKIMKMMKKVKLVSRIKTELQCQVPAGKSKILTKAIQALEDHPEMVKAFGVSQAQLDDIFMRLKYIDMDNIEASFKSKKLRKLGKGKKSKNTIIPVDFSGLYNTDSGKNISASVISQFFSLLSMNFTRQRKTKLKFCFRIIFPVILIVTIVIMVDSERADAVANAKKRSDEKAPSVRVPVADFQAMGKFGICVFDTDQRDDSKAVMEQVTADCQKMFEITKEEKKNVLALPKMKTTPMDKFMKQNDTQTIIRNLCRVAYCFFVFASSWDAARDNAKRFVQIAQYTVPSDNFAANEAAISIGHMLSVYLRFARHFNATPKSQRANLTWRRAYTINSFDGFSFKKCYDLLAFITAFSIVPITYLSDPIEDKDCGVRQHLASMGMSSLAYWLSTFLMHWLHYVLYFVMSVAACMVWDRYQSQFFLVQICAPVLLLGTTSSLLSVYVVSALLRKSNAIIMVTYLFFGLFLGVAALYLQDRQVVVLVLACAVPQFTPAVFILVSAKLMVYSLQYFDVSNPDLVPNLSSRHMSNTVVFYTLIAMAAHVVALVGLLILIENSGAMRCVCAKSEADPSESRKAVHDAGVKLEANRLEKSVRNQSNMLEVRDLQKVYPNGVRAVRGTTFGVFTGEILGLLGPNGAGKTTSMSIIVGEEDPSSGSSEVNFGGTWMSGREGAKFGAIGYCPQHNPLFNSISVHQHLCFYARIRGIQAQLANAQIAGLIDGLGLKPHQEKAAEQLSGGNKRRLCLAIALLGNPALVVIDEASTGVDPENKRFIWSAIRGMASKFRSVMITTHSMEEVEALCSRVGIMNKGVMIGFGTVQQLRSRHGEAYTLDILLKAKKPQKVAKKKQKLIKKISKQFKNAVLMEDLMRSVQFNLPRKYVPSFSAAMRWLISKKKKLGLQYFSLYQMSLDQVFVKLVKEYDES